MTALAADRDTVERENKSFSFPVAANTTIYAGAMVAVNNAGYAVPAGATASFKVVGRAEQRVTNGAVAGAVRVNVKRGLFRFANSASGDLIALADIGASAYAVDDQTVAKTSDSNARPVAGVIRDVDAQGVWVQF